VSNGRRFTYQQVRNARGQAILRPHLPVALAHDGRTFRESGLLDTGADVNVLPYLIGIELGGVWNEQPPLTGLSGNLTNYAARALVLTAVIEPFEPVELVFAWTQAEHVPLIFGQMNFFLEFDVCFYRSRGEFEIHQRG
jgi:hypothetical protein